MAFRFRPAEKKASILLFSNSHPQLRREGEEEQEEQQSILGISWNTKEDTLSVAVDETKFEEEATTPRMVVKQQALLFDPIGICAPFILLGRQWTQQSMVGPWGWDIKMSTEVIEGFNKWTESIPLLKKVKIARSWEEESNVGGTARRHVFVDASKKGYGCVIYRRIVGPTGIIRVAFLYGKAHVVPLDSSRSSHHGIIRRLEMVGDVSGMEGEQTIEASMTEEERGRRGNLVLDRLKLRAPTSVRSYGLPSSVHSKSSFEDMEELETISLEVYR